MTDLVDQLYRVAKLLPCTCRYQTQAGFPVYRHDQRVLEEQCQRCAAVARYEAERGANYWVESDD